MRLDPADRRSVGFAQILDELSKQRRPVYLELDPETSAIMRLRIPHVTRVVALHSIDDGVDVELERCMRGTYCGAARRTSTSWSASCAKHSTRVRRSS